MSLNLKANCYGLSTGCRKLYFFPVGCRKPEKVGKQCLRWLHLRVRLLQRAVLRLAQPKQTR